MRDKQEELLREAEKLASHMSLYQHDLAPNIIPKPECSEDAKEELLDRCDNVWLQMLECHNRLTLLGTETLPEADTQLSLLMMQVKSLTAECNQWQKKTPELISTSPELLLELGKQELKKLNQEFEMVLSSVQSKNRKLKEDSKRELRWLDEQQKLVEALTSRRNELKNQVVHFSEKRVRRDMEITITKIREFDDEILIALSDFLDEHFPLPEEHDQSSKKKKQSLFAGPVSKLKTLHDILETLIEKLLNTPHDPYVTVDESHWPPYIELLMRHGISLRHPETPNRIRLEAFHQ